ncbi:MAG TPA: hypothetical protein VEV63_17570 [Streptosporangiaceae bacterium]|nr:hypothetical protein [Streptosporangiaceae bacterium]
MSSVPANWRRARPTPKAMTLSLALLCVALVAGVAAAATRPASASLDGLTIATAAVTSPRAASTGFHESKTVTRINLINGKNVLVDKRAVSLSVSVTKDLIDRQVLKVRWSGAHPTGGIQNNPNDGANSQQQEYPMVLLECHGFGGSSAPLATQIQPQDCWTTTPSERFFAGDPGAPFNPWRLDRYATAAGQRNVTVNQPSPLPSTCPTLIQNTPTFWLNYVTPARRSFPIGSAGCAGMPNEMNLTGGFGLLPSNEMFAATNIHGRGNANFAIWTNELDPDLGCSQKVPCALVAVPVMGISCDPSAKGMPAADQPPADQVAAAAALCEEKGHFPPGSPLQQGELGQQDLTVSGQLWWAASNWRNRFVVPLTFAPPANICSIVNKGNHFVQLYGSELMDQAALQWQPHFCLNTKLFTLGYVQEPEPEAAGQLTTGTIEGALVSNQPAGGFPVPVVHAPVAETGFAISFVVDNAAGEPVTTLRLDPRLLAKLLTESYPAVTSVSDSDPEILHQCPGVPVPNSTQCTNPLNITLDPEFQALNPSIKQGVGASAAASVLLALSTNSDVMWALTSYINNNAAARAWLNGQPDPWGMVVDKKYRGIALPTSSWPLLSTYEPPDWKTGNGGGPGLCYSQNPSPVLPLVAAPVPDLPDIAEDIQFYIAQSLLQCTGNPSDPPSEHLIPLGPQTVGFRFVLGVTTLADARRFDLGTASLLTYTKPGTPAKFTSSAGMTFVAPTNESLRHAAALLIPDKKNLVWDFPYSDYRKDSPSAASAYPGAMLVYADLPTHGLPRADALDYAEFLLFSATAGQSPGSAVGQLPSGYLPVTPANNLKLEHQYTLTAALAVLLQTDQIPPLIPPKPKTTPTPTKSPSTSPTPTPTASNSPTASPSPSGTGSPGAGGTGTPGASGSPTPSSSGTSPGPTPSETQSPGQIGLTPAANFGLVGYILPSLAGLALLAAAGVLLISWIGKWRGAAGQSGAGGGRGRIGRRGRTKWS